MRAHDEVLILEELDRVLETEIKALAFDEGVTTKIHVRPGAGQLMREFAPERTWELLSRPGRRSSRRAGAGSPSTAT